MIADGEADALLAFEPIEAARATEVVSKRTVIIVNTSPIVPFTVGTWGQKYPPIEDVLKGLTTVAKKVVAFDAEALAKEAGNKVATNIVMLGALMGREIIPVPVDIIKETITLKVPKKAVELNLKAFELGYTAAKKA
jgi:indolepyruvate ferredoxin oxidoreductase beta subunit